MSFDEGDKIRIGSETYSIKDATRIDKAKIQSDTSGETYIVNLSNKLESTLSRQQIARTSFLALNDKQFERVSKILDIIRPLLNLEKRTQSDINRAAKQADVHPRTLYRYIRKFNDAGGCGLIIPRNFGGKEKSRTDREAEAILQQLLQEYMSDQRKSIKNLHKELSSECYKHGIKKEYRLTGLLTAG